VTTDDHYQRLVRLGDLLFAFEGEEAMLLSQLDAFLVGIAAGPELVSPTEWLPEIWGGDATDFAQYGVDRAELISLIMHHYNGVVLELGMGTYRPQFDIDEQNGDILWEIWLEGIEAAMALRLPAWQRLVRQRQETPAQMAAMGLFAHLAVANAGLVKDAGASAEETAEADDFNRAAPAELARLSIALFKANVQDAKTVPVRVDSVGRNDPCPCGSGKKYKRCHGAG
jgi:uncharacterized protein